MSDRYTAPARPVGVQDVIAPRVEQRPAARAVVDPLTRHSLTYRELWDAAGDLAAGLGASGVRRGDLVAVALDRSVDLVVALLGIIRAGAAYLPLDSQCPPERTAMILAESGVRHAVVGSRPGRRAPAGWQLPAGVRQVDWPAAVSAGPAAVPAGTAAVPAGAAASAGPVAVAAGGDAVAAGGDEPIYVAYTSGSTGRPKGVAIPHRAVLRLVTAGSYCRVRPGDRVANGSNPAFDATTFEIWTTLTVGGTVVILPTVTDCGIDTWVDLVRGEGITTVFLTTSLFHMVARERPEAFGSLATLVVGGEQLDLAATRRVLAAAPPGRLINGYGPTETTTFAAWFECTPASLHGLDRVPIGFPLENTTLTVLDPDLGPIPAGELGELVIGGPGVGLGYVARPELTGERFVPEPGGPPGRLRYRTGDLVRQLPSGALELVGRRDRQVKLRGFRIELEEVERATVATGMVDAAFVEKVGEGPAARLVGFVLPAVGLAADRVHRLAADLPAALRGLVPAYMVPARWSVLARLPLGPTGKVDRAGLLALLDQPAGESRQPGGPLDESAAPDEPGGPGPDAAVAGLRAIWEDLLGTRVRPADNFLELGGNSILAVQAAARIQQRMAVAIEPVDVLLADSLADLASRVRAATPTSA